MSNAMHMGQSAMSMGQSLSDQIKPFEGRYQFQPDNDGGPVPDTYHYPV
jgi:hypothetical protein